MPILYPCKNMRMSFTHEDSECSLDCVSGTEDVLLEKFRFWLSRKAISQQALWRPSPTAFQHLLDNQLAQLRWGTAAVVALHYSVDCPEPAQAGLALALEGVRKDQGLDAPQQLPTVCLGQYADGRRCTASAKQHGYCLRHQKPANAPPFCSSKHQLTVESLLSKLRDEVSQQFLHCCPPACPPCVMLLLLLLLLLLCSC